MSFQPPQNTSSLLTLLLKQLKKVKLPTEDVLPSINELSFQYEISRDIAEKGYKYLKKIGIIGSVPGKGYYIKSIDVDRKIRIFLMFNN